MSEKFSTIESEKKRNQKTGSAIFGCVGVFVFPIIGTAFTQNEVAANQMTLLANTDFILSLCLIPLVFFAIYKLDRIVERKVPKREREITDGEAEFLER